MLLLVAIVVAVALVPLVKGDLRALAALRFRLPGLVAAALVLQILVITVFPGPRTTLRLTAYISISSAGYGLKHESISPASRGRGSSHSRTPSGGRIAGIRSSRALPDGPR